MLPSWVWPRWSLRGQAHLDAGNAVKDAYGSLWRAPRDAYRREYKLALREQRQMRRVRRIRRLGG